MQGRTKVFAMYLPQYHEVEENSKFWGKGFTDWIGVKNNRPLYESHRQPRVPVNKNYYDLTDVEAIRWQCELARNAGIDGFGIYHYWFNENQNLLDTPPRLLLENEDIDISYFFSWDNTSWIRSWSKIKGNDWFPNGEKGGDKSTPQVLVQYELGWEKQWMKHFKWLLPFFNDVRYEKKDNKPLFMILNPSEGVIKMATYWERLACENGFSGMNFIFRKDAVHIKDNELIKGYDSYKYEPSTSGWSGFVPRVVNRLSRGLGREKLKRYDYNHIWKKIIKYASRSNESMYYCGFVDYDDTPRRGSKGRIVEGMTPEKFYRYLNELYKISVKQGKDYMFITAWNEWGEGAYLEPDEDNKMEILNAVKRALSE